MKRNNDAISLNQINSDKYERSKRLEWFDLERVSKSRVLVADSFVGCVVRL